MHKDNKLYSDKNSIQLPQGLVIQWHRLELNLKSSFNTAHTSTTVRHNFIVRMHHQGITGLGEAGLPPKKPGCYLADVQDCFQAMNQLKKHLLDNSSVQLVSSDIYCASLDSYFQEFKKDTNTFRKQLFEKLLNSIRLLLNEPKNRACVSALEFCLFDLWSKTLNRTLSSCIYLDPPISSFRSFYTVSVNNDVSKMVEEGLQAQAITPLVKIKLDDNFELISSVLIRFCQKHIGQKYVLDANASWSVHTALKLAAFLRQHPDITQKIHYIEQPFPLAFDTAEWIEIHSQYAKIGVKIMADQSFSVYQDLEKLRPLVDGVNIKIEKIGGLLNAVSAAAKCQREGIDVWVGTMISSQLGCTQAFQLFPFAKYGDVDGGLLTVPIFQGGFEWDQKTGLLRACLSYGLGVSQIKQF